MADEPFQVAIADMVACLEKQHFRFALVGGLAASIRGRIRVTEDVDFIVQCSVDQALELLARLDAQVFEPLFPEVEEVIRRSCILPLRHKGTGIPFDLAIGVSGFEQQIVQRATLEQTGSLKLLVATAEDLILMKLLAGRSQDNQDINGILAVHRKDLDWDYCLGVAGQLQEALGMDIVDRMNQLRESS